MASLLNRRFVYNEKTGKMEEIFFQPRARVHDIMPDLPDFVSTVDGRVVNGRRGLREHNKELGVTNTGDYTNQWRRWQDGRERLMTGKGPSQVETIRRAFDDLKEGRVKRR